MNKMNFHSQSFVPGRTMLLYPLAIVLFTSLFIGLHYMANQVPQEFLAPKLERDFRHHNLSVHNYPFNVFGAHSVLSNIGQNQYTECAVLLSVLATPENGLRGAILPPTTTRSSSKLCQVLKKTLVSVQSGVAIETRPLRPRYWWGARPVYSFMLRYFSVYQTREIIRNLTALAYTSLAITLLFISPAMFWISSPLLIFGIMFSGITYYSEVVLGVPYLWAIIAANILAALYAARIKAPLINLAVFCMGMVSSYLWLLDGHLILLFTWLMMVGYFATVQLVKPFSALVSTTKHVVSFSAGFALSMLSGQLTKAAYLGFGTIFDSLATAVIYRSSDVGPGAAELNLGIVFDKVWGIGYWWTGLFRHELLWSILIWSSCIAALLGTAIALLKGMRGKYVVLVSVLVCICIVLTVLARLFFLKNHSVIHAFFIGRYMFIPLAMAWVMLLVSLLKPDGPTAVENQQAIDR